MRRRVAVTGIGAVSPVGTGRERFWDALSRGESGVRPLTLFDASDLRHRAAGEIPDFKPEEILGPKGLRLLDRSTRLVLCAAALGLKDAGLSPEGGEGARVGVALGSTVGSLQSRASYYATLNREGHVGLNPALFPNTVVNSPASQASIRFGLTACNATLSSGTASSLHALDYAAQAIRLGRARAMLAGGFEELGEFLYLSFHQAGCLSDAARPYDRRRDGVVLGEGAAVLVLEEWDSARERGARVLAEYRGGGSSSDLEEAVGQALDEAERAPSGVGLTCSGGSGSPSGDAAEARALSRALGRKPLVCAVKGALGESYSAGGAFAAAAAVGSLASRSAFPTVGCEELDEACPVEVASSRRELPELETALVSALSPTGEAAACALARAE
ncbi:MAG TPA: beta-ketoacyl synthase N-terminal-like domain-containing protein [Elusimicrobiota bacterium]|nr:beta-ketoacyl synthase N-terminal-like domain-containing protein [Elusimicrobiota bacterium]